MFSLTLSKSELEDIINMLSHKGRLNVEITLNCFDRMGQSITGGDSCCRSWYITSSSAPDIPHHRNSLLHSQKK